MASLFRGGKSTAYSQLPDDDFPAGERFPGGTAAAAEYDDDENDIPMGFVENGGKFKTLGANAERALPRDSHELDGFLMEAYRYFEGQGMWTILLRRLVNLLVVGYVVVFSTFLMGCVDYHTLFETHDISQAVSLSFLLDVHWYLIVSLTVFSLFWLWHILHLFTQARPLSRMHQFYTQVLLIPDSDLETIEWRDVVRRIIEVHRASPDPPFKLDEYSIANRILRKDNYLIGLFNKELFELNLRFSSLIKTKQVLTKALEWNLSLTILNYFFDDHHRLKKKFLKVDGREIFASELKKRFILSGIINLILSPFIVLFLLMHFLFQYGEELHKNPGSLGSRQYTPLAKLRLREFNEYPHSFEKRLRASIPKADLYVKQFPSEKLAILARFVSFVAGSVAFILALLTIIDEDILLDLELTPGRSVLFYLGIFSAVYATARSFIPEESTVFEPQTLLSEIAEHTHYLPDSWKRRLHSDKVRREFVAMYEYRIMVFMMELLGVVFVPFILCFTLSGSSQDIVDFFRDFSVEKDESVGPICSFAAFDFKQNGDTMYGAPSEKRDTRMTSKGGKMERSFLYFKAANPQWQPDEDGQEYLDKVNQFHLKSSGLGMSTGNAEAGPSRAPAAEKETLKSSGNFGDSIFSGSAMVTSSVSSLNQSGPQQGGLMSVLNKIYESNVSMLH